MYAHLWFAKYSHVCLQTELTPVCVSLLGPWEQKRTVRGLLPAGLWVMQLYWEKEWVGIFEWVHEAGEVDQGKAVVCTGLCTVLCPTDSWGPLAGSEGPKSSMEDSTQALPSGRVWCVCVCVCVLCRCQ